jgi:hypothetical protein
MSGNGRNSEISFGQHMPAIAAAGEEIVSSMPAVSRRTFLAAGTAVGASLLLG